jgi:hypothetical protein
LCAPAYQVAGSRLRPITSYKGRGPVCDRTNVISCGSHAEDRKVCNRPRASRICRRPAAERARATVICARKGRCPVSKSSAQAPARPPSHWSAATPSHSTGPNAPTPWRRIGAGSGTCSRSRRRSSFSTPRSPRKTTVTCQRVGGCHRSSDRSRGSAASTSDTTSGGGHSARNNL